MEESLVGEVLKSPTGITYLVDLLVVTNTNTIIGNEASSHRNLSMVVRYSDGGIDGLQQWSYSGNSEYDDDNQVLCYELTGTSSGTYHFTMKELMTKFVDANNNIVDISFLVNGTSQMLSSLIFSLQLILISFNR